MIRVLHIISDSNIGGAGYQLLALVDKLDKDSFTIEVALPISSKLTPLLEKRGIVTTEIPYMAEKSFSMQAIKILYRLIKNKKPHIVHTHAALSGRIAARLHGNCKIIYTRHSVFEPKKRAIAGMINNYLCDAIIAVSPAAKDNLLAEGAKENKITVIYNGLPPAEVRTVSRERFNIPDNAFVLAQIARLVKIKGHDDVLDAAKKLNNVCILIAGDGERREHLAARIADENITNVKLLGFMDDVEISNVMDAQINASFGTEATSLALITGMSLGKPAVATDYGGNPYVIEHEYNGLIVPTNDADALAAAISRLQNDKDLYIRLSEGAKKRYSETFSHIEMTRQTEALYRGLRV